MNDLVLAKRERRDIAESKIDGILSRILVDHFDLGEWLAVVHDEGLYLDDFQQFNDYALNVWGLPGDLGTRFVDAFNVAKNLAKAKHEFPLLYWYSLSELTAASARILSKLPAESQAEAWSQATEASPSPTANLLEQIVQDLKPEYARIDQMSKGEELQFIKKAEKRIGDAYDQSSDYGARLAVEKKLNSMERVCDEARVQRNAAFATVVEAINMIREAMKRVQPPTVEGTPIFDSAT